MLYGEEILGVAAGGFGVGVLAWFEILLECSVYGILYDGCVAFCFGVSRQGVPPNYGQLVRF